MGFLKGRIEDYGSPLAGLPARLFAGWFFFKFGLDKATGGFGGGALRSTLQGWSAETPYAFYAAFLEGLVIPNAGIFAALVTAGEILVGAALLAGAATRLFALVGLFLCLNFLLATGAPLVSLERPVVFALLCLTVFASAAGRAVGLNYLLKSRLPRWIA
jgi:thiosulfate dehydrogenase [quinone] large subunit